MQDRFEIERGVGGIARDSVAARRPRAPGKVPAVLPRLVTRTASCSRTRGVRSARRLQWAKEWPLRSRSHFTWSSFVENSNCRFRARVVRAEAARAASTKIAVFFCERAPPFWHSEAHPTRSHEAHAVALFRGISFLCCPKWRHAPRESSHLLSLQNNKRAGAILALVGHCARKSRRHHRLLRAAPNLSCATQTPSGMPFAFLARHAPPRRGESGPMRSGRVSRCIPYCLFDSAHHGIGRGHIRPSAHDAASAIARRAAVVGRASLFAMARSAVVSQRWGQPPCAPGTTGDGGALP